MEADIDCRHGCRKSAPDALLYGEIFTLKIPGMGLDFAFCPPMRLAIDNFFLPPRTKKVHGGRCKGDPPICRRSGPKSNGWR